MIKGILIGVNITLGIEFLIVLCIYFYKEIIEKFSWMFSPFFHPIASFYLITIGLNPWHLSISKILSLSDEQFNGWLNVLNEKNKKRWETLRKRNCHGVK